MTEQPAHELSIAGTFFLVMITMGMFVGLIRLVHWIWTW
jgi:hypothetical protein